MELRAATKYQSIRGKDLEKLPVKVQGFQVQLLFTVARFRTDRYKCISTLDVVVAGGQLPLV